MSVDTLNADLATLRRPHVAMYADRKAAADRVEAELSRLREEVEGQTEAARENYDAAVAAEAECARLRQALAALYDPASQLADPSHELTEIEWYGVMSRLRAAVGDAEREALAGPDTPAASCEKCRHAAHEPGRCGANVGTGYHGLVLCRCGSGPDTPADSQPEETTT